MSSSGPSPSSAAFRGSAYSQSRQASYMTDGSPSDLTMGETFTAQMRDRQSRGKDPYHSGDASDASDSERDSPPAGSRLRLGSGRSDKEDFSRIERRDKAAAFLDSPELLMMYAQSTGDSIPGARLHFMKMLCGYEDDPADKAAAAAAAAAASGPGNASGSSRKSGGRRVPQQPARNADKRRGGDRASTDAL